MFCGAQVASRISVPLFEGLVSFSGDSSVSLREALIVQRNAAHIAF